MKKYRVNTTISQKHHEILKEYAKEYGTQQSVLEHALEALKNTGDQGELSSTGQLWMRIFRELKDIHILFQRDLAKIFFENMDIDQYQDYIRNEKPGETAIEWYYNKPLKECTLQEIVHAVVAKLDVQGGADTLICTEDEESYRINMTHTLGINASKAIKRLDESIFESYGAKYETHYSERSIFFKVYKDK
jgi:hypothetical protein